MPDENSPAAVWSTAARAERVINSSTRTSQSGSRAQARVQRPPVKHTQSIDFARINRAALTRLPDILARWLPGGRIAGRGAVAGQGRPLELYEPGPRPSPVDGAALLEQTLGAIRQFVILTEHQAEATALWVIFTYAFDAFDFSPPLVVSSADKRSGKTRLVEWWTASFPNRCLSLGLPGRRCYA